VRIPRRLPRPIDRDTLKAVLRSETRPANAQPSDQEITILMIKLLIEEGTDIRMVQALLGHANLRTTEIYVRVSNHALKRALERADILDVLRH
jgi:site-specific recombinase XerC